MTSTLEEQALISVTIFSQTILHFQAECMNIGCLPGLLQGVQMGVGTGQWELGNMLKPG